MPLTADSAPQQSSSAHELKRQLALKDQDLSYARQRAEKANNELQEFKRATPSENVSKLEDEKNALLDYIEEMSKTDATALKRQIADMEQDHAAQISELQQMVRDQQQLTEGTFGKDFVLDLQKQLEQTRQHYESTKSAKLDLQLQLDAVKQDERISDLEALNQQLSDTLHETQTELEELVTAHEALSSENCQLKV